MRFTNVNKVPRPTQLCQRLKDIELPYKLFSAVISITLRVFSSGSPVKRALSTRITFGLDLELKLKESW